MSKFELSAHDHRARQRTIKATLADANPDRLTNRLHSPPIVARRLVVCVSEMSIEIREIVEKRINDGTVDPDWANAERGAETDVVEVDDLWDEESGTKKRGKPVTPIQIARDMKDNDRLDEKAVIEAITRGDVDLVIAAVSVLSDIDLDVIEKAMDTQDPKAVISICWKAGLSAPVADQMQSKIAGIKEDGVLKAKGSKFPIEKAQMEDQISRLATL